MDGIRTASGLRGVAAVFAALWLWGAPVRGEEPVPENTGPVKYVFLLIGDGYGPNQRYITEALLGRKLAMSGLEATVPTGTNNISGGVTDSAASGTAIACGVKTYNGAIGLDNDGNPVESVAVQLQRRGFKIAMLSSSPLTDATPAAHYSHQKTRGMGREIGLDMARSGFDLFGGAGVMAPREAVFEMLAENGYALFQGKDALGKAEKGVKTFVDQAPYVPWDIAEADLPEHTHAGYLAKAIALLDNPTGFFIMLENGQIDGAGHSNDAGKMVREVIALDEAVKVALAFREQRGETLVIVTADHETGGLTVDDLRVGELPLLWRQKGPKADIEKRLRERLTAGDGEDALFAALADEFGCDFTPEERAAIQTAQKPGNPGASARGMTAAAAWARDARLGFAFTTGGHSNQKIITNVQGPGAERFHEPMENSDIPHLIRSIMTPELVAPGYMEARRDAVRLADSLKPFADAAPGLRVIFPPRVARTSRLGDKTFDLSWPRYERFASAEAKAGPGGYLFRVGNANAAESVYFRLGLPDDVAPDMGFFVFNPAARELFVNPAAGSDGDSAERWSKAALAEFVGVCPPGREMFLMVSTVRPEDCARVPAVVSAPPVPPDAVLEVRAADAAPNIDGDLSDAAWRDAAVYAFVDVNGGELAEPATVRLVSNQERSTLYLAFTVPDEEWVVQAARRDEAVFMDDSIEIFLGSMDQKNYFQIVINPAGALYDQDSLSGAAWNAEIQYGVGRDKAAKQWSLEVALPLGQLGLTAPLEANFCRTDQPGGRHSNLSPTGGDFHNRHSFRPIDLVD